jgi:hypothetical protein
MRGVSLPGWWILAFMIVNHGKQWFRPPQFQHRDL